MSSMLRRPSRMHVQEWSLLLNNNSEDYVVPAADLAPLDPRTQDPNIAPWADIEQEDEEIQALPPTTPTGKRVPNKGSSFSLTTGGLFGRQQRNNDAQDAQSIAGGDSKKSFLSIKGLRRKNSKASLAKEPTFSIPTQPVPPVPGNLVIPSGSIPRPPPSPPTTRSKFRKPSKNKQAPPVPAKDPGDDIFLDTNFDSLDGIVDSSRLGADSRISFTHDAPSSITLQAVPDDAPVSHHQYQNSHNQANGMPPPSQPAPPPPPPPQILRQRQRPSVAPYDPMASTESWDFMQAAATGTVLPGYPPTFSAAPFNAAAFTNPFAGSSPASLAQRRKPQPLLIGSSSPTNRPLPLLPPPSATLDLNGTGASGGFPATVSPTDTRLGINDPASPSWVAPESWGVKRMSADEGAGSISGESENLEMMEPIRNGVSMHPQDDENDQSLQGHSQLGRQHSMQAGGIAEYKIRVLQEVEAMASPYMVFKVPYTETAQSFIKTKWNPKIKIDSECRLWIRDRGRDRMLAGTERILPLLRKRLEMAGYDDDELTTIAGEDLGHIFKLIVRDVTWRADSEEPAQVANPAFVDLTGMNLTKVPILLHRVAAHIVLLNLSRNIGIDLPSDFIQSCEALRELKLAGVGLRRVPPAIRHSRYLARLDISANRIADLEDSGLDSIPTLASLKLQSNRLKNLPNYFGSMHTIKDLNVSNNKFDGFPIVLFAMTSLLDLDVSYNNIRAFPPNIGKLVNLQRLTIIGNQLSSFAPECAQLVNLEVLDCRRNMITDIAFVAALPKLKQFHSHYNAVQVLDVAIGPGLTDLKAPHNQITRLKILETPQAITLMHLDLSYTKLSSIDDAVIAQLVSLSTLRLDHNHFRTLPASLCKLIYLQHLSCSNNVLDELPTDIGNLENLQIFDVHSNSLHQIPASIWQCKSLYLFNATSNLIDLWRNPPSATGQGSASMPSGSSAQGSISEGTLPEGLTVTPSTERRPSQAAFLGGRSGRRALPLELSLQKLYMSDNLLRDDGIYFLSRLPQLRVLNISFNDIQDLPSTWLQRLPLLEELYLSGNKLSALPVDGLQVLTKLHTLYLNGNRLQTLPSALNKIPTLTVLDVGSNMLRYNINNWHFDWNWNFNRNLRYLNLSGNTRLEIRAESTKRNALFEKPEGPVLHEFSALTQLKVLGLMDVTTGFISNIPDDNEERRVRTSGSEINGMGYGIADSIGKLNQLSMFDIVVPSFRMHDNECLFGMFGRPEGTHGNTRLTKFVQDRFHSELIIKLNQLRPELDEGVVQAFRRAFLSMNRELYKFLTNSSFGPFSRKMSTASASSSNIPGVDPSTLKSGLSAVIIYIVDKTMYVANVGNALAVVSRQGTAHLVSYKHDPLDRNELSRIRSTEAWVSQRELLNDEMNVSRSFGMYHLLPSVIARPAVVEWDITDQDEFVIIGNCNLWDYVPYQNAVDIARQCRDPMAAAQKLRDMAISYGADGSVMIMVLSVSDLFPAKAVQRRNAIETGEFGGFRNPLRGNAEPISSKMLNRLPDEVDAPVGTIALVFTDIVNSTHLWEKNAGMRTAILMHNELLRRQLLTIGGYLVKTEGDAFMCAFPTVVSAVLWCLTVQSTLLKLDWPLEILESQDGREIRDANDVVLARGLSVRMGLHWGAPLCEPDFITHRMDYFGPMVNRSARICGSAKGGQLMISNDVIKELSQQFSIDGSTPPPAPSKLTDPASSNDPDVVRERGHIETLRRMQFSVTPVGERRLKGIEAPEELSLLWAKELEGRKNIVHNRDEEDVSAAAADASSRVPFSIAQMKQLAMLCVRLETLTSNRVFKSVSARKRPVPPIGPLPAMTAVLEEDEGAPLDIVPGINGIRPAPQIVVPHTPPEPNMTTNPVYLIANPDLLMPPIKEGATDEYLMLLLDSLSLRIDNALASLYLKQQGGYLPLTGSRVGSIVDLEGLGLTGLGW